MDRLEEKYFNTSYVKDPKSVKVLDDLIGQPLTKDTIDLAMNIMNKDFDDYDNTSKIIFDTFNGCETEDDDFVQETEDLSFALPKNHDVSLSNKLMEVKFNPDSNANDEWKVAYNQTFLQVRNVFSCMFPNDADMFPENECTIFINGNSKENSANRNYSYKEKTSRAFPEQWEIYMGQYPHWCLIKENIVKNPNIDDEDSYLSSNVYSDSYCIALCRPILYIVTSETNEKRSYYSWIREEKVQHGNSIGFNRRHVFDNAYKPLNDIHDKEAVIKFSQKLDLFPDYIESNQL